MAVPEIVRIASAIVDVPSVVELDAMLTEARGLSASGSRSQLVDDLLDMRITAVMLAQGKD